MDNLTLPAPAKLNLFLHVLGRDPDGYHRLQTVFQLVDYGDELDFRSRSDDQLRLRGAPRQLEGRDNLVLRAARALREATGHKGGADIRLTKQLPMGGGIGGGSSDAATTLLALNQMWETGLDLEQLAAVGLLLGADLPVFIKGRSAWAEGRGEKLRPLDLPDRWYLVLDPGCPVSTAAVFQHPELTRDSAPITVAAFLEQGGRNDCQSLVAKLFPPVAQAIRWLDHRLGGSGITRMTGTGASVYAAFESHTEASAVLRESPWPGFVARAVNRSPVHDRLPPLARKT